MLSGELEQSQTKQENLYVTKLLNYTALNYTTIIFHRVPYIDPLGQKCIVIGWREWKIQL